MGEPTGVTPPPAPGSPGQPRTSANNSPPRLRAFELAPFVGVWTREFTLFRRYWLSTTFSSIVEPTIYLLAFGFGMGALVASVDGIPYIEFVGTGTVATAVLFASVFGGMFTTYVRRTYQHTYDGLLSTPVDVHEVVLAEATWTAAKAGIYGCAPLLVAIGFGLPPSLGMLAVPFIGFLTGLGFALFGMLVSGIVKSIDAFSYVTSAVITPLFLLAGTFFPLTSLPPWAQQLAQLNPLYHCVSLVRQAAFGWLWPQAGLDVLALVIFAVLMAWLAIRQLRRKLID